MKTANSFRTWKPIMFTCSTFSSNTPNPTARIAPMRLHSCVCVEKEPGPLERQHARLRTQALIQHSSSPFRSLYLSHCLLQCSLVLWQQQCNSRADEQGHLGDQNDDVERGIRPA